MLKKIILAATLLIGLTATSAFAATPTQTTTKTATTTTATSQISPITYVSSIVTVGSTQDSIKLTWKYVDLAYGYNVYIDGVKQPGNPLKDPNVTVVDDGISYYQQWVGNIAKGTHTISVTTVYPTGVETQPYTFTVTAP